MKLWLLIRNLSIVDSSFVHGKNLKMGYFNVIKSGVKVGNNVNIQNFVLLKSKTKIGNDCFIDSYVRSSGDNRIGNNVVLRFGSTIARKVYVDDGAFISPNAMTVFSLPDGTKSNRTYIGRGVFIGTAVVLAPNITISDSCIIGANSFVNKSCHERGVYAGNPAKLIRKL